MCYNIFVFFKYCTLGAQSCHKGYCKTNLMFGFEFGCVSRKLKHTLCGYIEEEQNCDHVLWFIMVRIFCVDAFVLVTAWPYLCAHDIFAQIVYGHFQIDRSMYLGSSESSNYALDMTWRPRLGFWLIDSDLLTELLQWHFFSGICFYSLYERSLVKWVLSLSVYVNE